jgi:ribosomal protein L19
MIIRVEQARGNKDHYTVLNKSVLDDLRKYFKVYNPKTYLIEVITPGK